MASAADILKKFKERQLDVARTAQLPPAVDPTTTSTIRDQRRNRSSSSSAPWIFSYADLMSLLLGMFVMLFAMSSVNKERVEEAMGSVKQAINGRPSGRDEKWVKSVDELYSEIEDMVVKEKLTGVIELSKNPHGIVIAMGDQILFPPGTPDLTRAAKLILHRLARILIDVPYQLEVSGHTDNVPIRSEKFPTNWELSASRACSVVKYLITFGQIASKRLVAKGYAEFAPRVPNISRANRAKNRRIEILVLRS